MKIFSSKVHGYVDYTLGAFLLVAPYLLDFSDVRVAAVSAQVVGVVLLVQSLMTNYELGIFKVIPFKTHLMLDVGVSLVLAATPFIFGFYDFPENVWMAHVVAGLGYLVFTLLTTSQVVPDIDQKRTAPVHA